MNAWRPFVFVGLGYLAILLESALGLLVPGTRPLVCMPELSLFVVIYLGLAGRGGAAGLVACALSIGYLRDLVLGSPRGLEALAFAVVALGARSLHGRVFLDRYGQLGVVTLGFALLHGVLVGWLGSGDAPLLAALRPVPGLLVGPLLLGPLALRAMRRFDQRFVTDTRSIELDGRSLGGGWK